MKNWTRHFARLLLMIILFSIALLFTGCLSSKKIVDKEKTTTKTEKTENRKDSTNSEKVNKKIDDAITIGVPFSDPEVDRKIDEILSRLNTKKTSGDNSYKLYYDKKLRELKAEFLVGETKDKSLIVNSDSKSEKSFEEVTIEKTKKVIRELPWWVWLIVIWLLRRHIIDIISIFIPGVKKIKSISDLLNPPNKKET